MTEVAPAADQLEAMREALAVVEAKMLEGAGDGRVFHQLRERRERMQAELQRLEMLARREAAEAERAHLRALHERLGEACDRAAAIRREGEAVDQEIGDLLAALAGLLARGGQLTREHRDCAARADNAITALRKAGETPRRAGIGAWSSPGQDAALATYVTGHRTLIAAGLSATSAAAVTSLQHAKLRG
jgi:hypothetical protein